MHHTIRALVVINLSCEKETLETARAIKEKTKEEHFLHLASPTGFEPVLPP